jgi:hypothetical protein
MYRTIGYNSMARSVTLPSLIASSLAYRTKKPLKLTLLGVDIVLSCLYIVAEPLLQLKKFFSVCLNWMQQIVRGDDNKIAGDVNRYFVCLVCMMRGDGCMVSGNRS